MRVPVKLVICGGLLAMLAACDGHNDSSPSSTAATPTTPAPPSPSATQQAVNSIGSQFATDFNANPNSVPVKPSQSDLPAVSLTTDPIAVK